MTYKVEREVGEKKMKFIYDEKFRRFKKRRDKKRKRGSGGGKGEEMYCVL